MQNPLDECKMWFPGIMHEQADLLNGIGQIRTSQSEAPTILLYSEGSATGGPSIADSLDLLPNGIKVESHSLIPVHCIRSEAYCP